MRHAPAGERADGVAQHVGRVDDGGDQLGVVEDAPQRAGHRDEPAWRQLGADGVAHDVLEDVRFVEDDDIVLGQDHPAAADVEPVEVGVDDDDVGGGGSPPGLLGEARLAEWAAVGAGALVAADAHRSPRRVARRPVELGAVAGVGGADPLGDPADLVARPGCHALQLELGLGPAVHLPQPLQAHVVAAALQHGPVERHRQRRLEEGKVLAGQLVLQRLGGGGHDHPRPGRHGRHEVGQGLARAGTGLHDEVAAAVDGCGDEVGHLDLPRPVLGPGELGGDLGKDLPRRLAHGTRANAVSSSAASNSGQVLSVKWIAAPALCHSRKFETRRSPDVRTSTSTGGSSGR